MSSNAKLDKVLKAIKRSAKEIGINENEVTKVDIFSFNDDVTDWDLRVLGGLDLIKRKFFPLQGKELDVIQENKQVSAYISKLEKQLGDKISLENEIKESIKKLIQPIPSIKLQNVKKQKSKVKREIVAVLNDTHYGLLVDKEEINGLNSFGWKEACRRTAMVISEAIDFKPHTRDEVEKVHLVLNGDIIAGLIHGLNYKGLDQYVHQLNGTLHILIYAVSNLLQNFNYVELHGISGNHEDAVHKREHGNRVLSEKYDSYLNTVLFGLSAAFRNNSRVKFNFPKTPYLFFDLPGGRAMAAHGDVLFSRALGNPGRNINVKLLGDEIRDFNAGLIAKGEDPVKLVLLGHCHSYAHFITKDGVEVYIAPSLSGIDGYAHSLNINTNFIGQVVFESTPDFILGDSRLIRVNKADDNSDLDNIIPIFTRELSWK